MKTVALRLDDEMHDQLTMIAQLNELTQADAIREAIEQWITLKRSAPELTEWAQSMLDDVDRDAARRRSAIARLLGETSEPKPTEGTEPPHTRRTPRGKGGEPAGS